MKRQTYIKRMIAAACTFAAAVMLFTGGGPTGMRANQTYVRERKALRIAPEAGVDLTTSPLSVDARRGTDMCNLVGECGTLYKRPGWRQEAQVFVRDSDGRPIYGRIHGMWYFDDGREEFLLVHAGDKLHRVSLPEWTWSEEAVVTVADERSSGVALAGRLWMVGAGGFYAFGYDEESEDYTVRRVAEMEDVYIPVTTVGISDINAEADARTSLDPVNLLTAKRINQMVGRELESSDMIFQLDGKPRLGSDLTVRIETASETYVDLITTGYRENLNPTLSAPIKYAEANLVREDNGAHVGKVDYLAGTIWFNESVEISGTVESIGSIAPPVEGVDNIIVTFEAEGGDQTAFLDTAEFGILFGEDGLTDRLLLGGFEEARNRVYYSAPGNPLYFPDRNYFSAGSDMARVIGFSRISDGVLAVHKEELGGEPTVYYLSMEAEADAAAYTVTVTPCVTAGNRGEPILSRDALCDFMGDPLALTADGVVAITLRSNLATAERQTVERSRSIRAALTALSASVLSEAVATVHRGRYWLALPGGLCYVADGGDTYTDESGRRQYEWYILDGIPATAFCSFGGRLYFGTEDGRICRLCERSDTVEGGSLYADRTFTAFFGDGDLVYDLNRGVLTYDPALLPMREGDSIRFDTWLHERLAAVGTFEASGGRVVLGDPNDIGRYHEGLTVRIFQLGSLGTTVWTVQDIDRADGSFSLYDPVSETYWDGEVNASTPAELLHSLVGEELIIASVSEGGDGERPHITVKRYPGDAEVLSVTVPIGLMVNLCGRIIHDEPVRASWYSGIFDMGSNLSEKTLHSLTVSVCPGSGRVSVGYVTRESEALFGSEGIGGVDLGDLTFHDFSFVGFASSYTQPINRRRVNFVKLRFLSEMPEPCAVYDITVTYSVTGHKRGGL